jgi:hypothetical protein
MKLGHFKLMKFKACSMLCMYELHRKLTEENNSDS